MRCSAICQDICKENFFLAERSFYLKLVSAFLYLSANSTEEMKNNMKCYFIFLSFEWAYKMEQYLILKSIRGMLGIFVFLINISLSNVFPHTIQKANGIDCLCPI